MLRTSLNLLTLLLPFLSTRIVEYYEILFHILLRFALWEVQFSSKESKSEGDFILMQRLINERNL